MSAHTSTTFWLVAKRQLATIFLFVSLFAISLAVLYGKDRQREWRLREEQADHRLELAYELITRDLERVRSDILDLANQGSVRELCSGDTATTKLIEEQFGRFLKFKQTYQQMRLLDDAGQEKVRVDLRGAEVHVVPQPELQDKKDRYYFRESIRLEPGEVFVSEFDLNQEHGIIERPLNPVIRFVTPVICQNGKTEALLVANYLGAPLLSDLATISLPGKTLVLRDDGQYLLGPDPDDAWGWLLNHQNTFATQFPDAWRDRQFSDNKCFLTPNGAFSFRGIEMQRFGKARTDKNLAGNKLLLVSYLPSANVFQTSNQLLNRLLVIGSILLLPLFLLTRFWAVASVRRQQQNFLILESEKKLRELSSRLVRIQEEERRAISRQIHDQLGQQVTAINLDLKLAQREAGSDKICEQLQRAIDESEQLLNTLHEFATRVRPVELDDLGLHDAVESHLWEFTNRTGIEFSLNSNIERFSVPPIIAENVYRLIQEALNNVLKHANASNVQVSIWRTCDPNTNRLRTNESLKVVVSDDGVGTSNLNDAPETNGESVESNSRLGVLGMQERVDLLGGTFEFTMEADQGTTVEVMIPLVQAADENAL